MLVFIDTNILISAALNPGSAPARAFTKAVSLPNRAVICEQNIEELRRVFRVKFPGKMHLLDAFLRTAELALTVVDIPTSATATETGIRDPSDRPILRAAIACGAHVFVTGDKDFLEAMVATPRIVTARTFIEM
ncbi:putative toxin-antitoxin system toxin component, PIN family [Actinotignum sanguinis]|uniref:putative toxin-antitoxin system toxin component, PIN family n=1 Tax=Actinotignum sanguinis TaxID=1445614 RepID=UPI000F7F6D2A|nr:putative toxin-antitoxin system toxin component, PIN family [Actinotignum sanguinis]MDY5148322.1 putative toxin-antitoxin system toxin component, PIN family [Actinotignum sanguinis]RTE47879.1 putative toxin-antitoxin system toxin component, PIN family [Actinotignum sanguinis]